MASPVFKGIRAGGLNQIASKNRPGLFCDPPGNVELVDTPDTRSLLYIHAR